MNSRVLKIRLNFSTCYIARLGVIASQFAELRIITFSAKTEDTTQGGVLCFGGEGEIRTLEPCYRLHDFQSCALDQLGDFSKFI